MSASNNDRLVQAQKGDRAVKSPVLERRQGQVTDVDPVTGTATVSIGGDPNTISGVRSESNYVPKDGDSVDLDVSSTDVKIVGRRGDVGPSVFSGVAQASVITPRSPQRVRHSHCTRSPGTSPAASTTCLHLRPVSGFPYPVDWYSGFRPRLLTP